ncbi:MAG: helix-turn-helix domain-containing protein, partial [Chloroflexi bacterium]|nr:helix-turn-helix domain-containing protein [Chloroflexota bacterium]
KGATDLFLAQTAVYDLLLGVEQHQGKIVLILDQFDRFCHIASSELTMLLRALRDSFKETLIYIVGMRQAAMYMPEPDVMGELYQLLDMHICWVGAMSKVDAREFIVREVGRGQQTMPVNENEMLITLTGGYATLLKAACAWWSLVDNRPPVNKWKSILVQHPPIKIRLDELWHGLTQEDQWTMGRLQSGIEATKAKLSQKVLIRLGNRGVCFFDGDTWQINGTLLADFVQTAVKQGLGRIWQDALTGDLYQGVQRIDGLRPLEEALLAFLIQNPYKPHTKSELITQVWPEGTHREGVTDDSLYQIVRGVRSKIEPKGADVPVYLRTKRGVTEGGYQFFAEGYPAITS